MVYKLKIATIVFSSLFLTTYSAPAMNFSLGGAEGSNRYILGSGPINDGDELVLSSMLSALPDVRLFVLSSPGGSVAASLSMGQTARSAHITTMVAPASECLSACLFAFIGGVKRHVPTNSNLGSHQFRWSSDASTNRDAQIAQGLSAKVLRHFISMGVDPDALTYILETSPNDMFVFSEYALTEFNLTTPKSAPEKKILVDRCTGKIVEGDNQTQCSNEAYWRHITVPDFLKLHAEYSAGSEAYNSLDKEVRRLQAAATNPFDPEILVRAHRRVTAQTSE